MEPVASDNSLLDVSHHLWNLDALADERQREKDECRDAHMDEYPLTNHRGCKGPNVRHSKGVFFRKVSDVAREQGTCSLCRSILCDQQCWRLNRRKVYG